MSYPATWNPGIRTILITVLFSLSLYGGLQAAGEASSFAKIDDAYRAGKIDRSQMLVDRMTAFFAPQNLSAEFKSTAPSFLKSGTELLLEVKDQWDDFSPEQQSLLAEYMGQPTMDTAFYSPGGHFKIHYDTIGAEMVPPQDVDGDAVPDYVERTAAYCDSAWRAYEAMGYLPPPNDSPAGGDERYDIYLLAISGYGLTFPDGPGDSVWNDAKSHIGIHYSFDVPWLFTNDDPEGDTIGAQKVTCAHEFFHATQLAYVYNSSEFLWLMEANATWMEEVVYPEVNDNQNYLPSFFDYPQRGINSLTSNHQYGSFIWGGFLQQKFDYTAIRKAWEASRYNLSLDATDSALAYFGTNLKGVLPEFEIWNYYTGNRALLDKYYAEATDYPQVSFDQWLPTLVHDSIEPLYPPDGMGCNYIRYDVDTSAHGILEIYLQGSNLVRWGLDAVCQGNDSDVVVMKPSIGTTPISIYIPFIEDYTEVTAIPLVISRYLTANNYYLTTRIIPYGDANYDFSTDVGDASYLINYVFYSGAAPKPILETGDANCDGNVNIADAVSIINYVFKNGDEPCTPR